MVVKWSLSQLGQARREDQREVTCSMSVISLVVSWKMLGQAHCSLLPVSPALWVQREGKPCSCEEEGPASVGGPLLESSVLVSQ